MAIYILTNDIATNYSEILAAYIIFDAIAEKSFQNKKSLKKIKKMSHG